MYPYAPQLSIPAAAPAAAVAVGSPVRLVQGLRASRPATAPARARTKKLAVGSPKWWARVAQKSAAETARRLAFEAEQDTLIRELREAVEDDRNMLALWWLRVRFPRGVEGLKCGPHLPPSRSVPAFRCTSESVTSTITTDVDLAWTGSWVVGSGMNASHPGGGQRATACTCCRSYRRP